MVTTMGDGCVISTVKNEFMETPVEDELMMTAVWEEPVAIQAWPTGSSSSDVSARVRGSAPEPGVAGRRAGPWRPGVAGALGAGQRGEVAKAIAGTRAGLSKSATLWARQKRRASWLNSSESWACCPSRPLHHGGTASRLDGLGRHTRTPRPARGVGPCSRRISAGTSGTCDACLGSPYRTLHGRPACSCTLCG